MADQDDKSYVPSPDFFRQAAGSLVNLGLRYAMGMRPTDPSQQRDESWIGRLIGQYGQLFGEQSDKVRAVLERVGQFGDVVSGQRLLFRARARRLPEAPPQDPNVKSPDARSVCKLSEAEQQLHAFVEIAQAQSEALPDGKPIALLSGDLIEALDKHPNIRKARKDPDEYEKYLDALLSDPERVHLPRVLESLRHEVRGDRNNGIRLVHDRLKWLLAAASGGATAYELLDAMSDVLGEAALREALRLCAVPDYLRVDEDIADWRTALEQCLSTIGHTLSPYVSVLYSGSKMRREYIVLDHDSDQRFEIRQSSVEGSADRDHGWEIHGAQEGTRYTIELNADRETIRLPLRIQDATQGLATWSVDKQLVQEMLNPLGTRGRLAMRAWDTGGNRTPVALFFVHYKQSDLDDYFELGIGAFVAPRNDPLAVGIYPLGPILVSSERSEQAGRRIWGYDKIHVIEKNWKVRYRPGRLECDVQLGGATLCVRMPRGGIPWNSTAPLLSYTVKPVGGLDAGLEQAQWHRALLTRFATHESIRPSGDGFYAYVENPSKVGAEGGRLVKELLNLGILHPASSLAVHPLHIVWTEHVASQLSAPMLVAIPDQDFG